jgi:hypothetical protein
VALEYVPVHRVVGCADPQRDVILYPRCLDPNRFLFSSQACRCDRDHSANTELVMMETQTVQNAHCLVPKNYSNRRTRQYFRARYGSLFAINLRAIRPAGVAPNLRVQNGWQSCVPQWRQKSILSASAAPGNRGNATLLTTDQRPPRLR